MTEPQAYDPQWRRVLLRKGSEVAASLSALLDHKEVDLSHLPPKLLPEDDPELRLRRFLAQIDFAIKSFGTERFGRCGICDVALPFEQLAQQPWAARCAAHAGVQTGLRQSERG